MVTSPLARTLFISFSALMIFYSGLANSQLSVSGILKDLDPATPLPRTVLLDPSQLSDVREALVSNDHIERSNSYNNSLLDLSFQNLILQANLNLTKDPHSVTDKNMRLLPNGVDMESLDRHDFISLSPYYWPDPTKADGLPYIGYDGVTNPRIKLIADDRNLHDMISKVKLFSAAYYFTDKPQYASKAAELLRVWFISNETRMNPNLEHAEIVPGKHNGMASGIITTKNIADIIDSIALLQHSAPSSVWTKQDQEGMRMWFIEYLDWLLNSDKGKEERQKMNNHGTWYDVQASSIALFLNKTAITKQILGQVMEKLNGTNATKDRIIFNDGRQPFELVRTNSLDYSVFNLLGLFKLARMGEHVGIDLWNYSSSDEESKPILQRALDFLLPYLLEKRQWPYPEIIPVDRNNLADLLCQATLDYPNDHSYSQVLKSMRQIDIVENPNNLLYGCI